jgi:hypothetical protein
MLKRLSNGVVKGWPYGANQLALAVEPLVESSVGPGPVCQQHDGDCGFQINPQRTAAEPKMPD